MEWRWVKEFFTAEESKFYYVYLLYLLQGLKSIKKVGLLL